MVLQPFPNFPRIDCCTLQTISANPETPIAVLETARSKESALLALSEVLGPKLVVPEVWREILPHAGILISSSISGGSLRTRFQEAAQAAPRRCWLLLEPMQVEFPLPCPDGNGRVIATIPAGKSFYSDFLCCQYTHFIRNQQGVIAAWDTKETLTRKLQLAQQAGFLGFAEAPCISALS